MTGIQLQLRARSRCAVLAAVVVTFLGISTQPASAIIGGQLAAPGFFGYVTFVGAVTAMTAYYCTGALVDSERQSSRRRIARRIFPPARSRSGQVVSTSTTRARGRCRGHERRRLAHLEPVDGSWRCRSAPACPAVDGATAPDRVRRRCRLGVSGRHADHRRRLGSHHSVRATRGRSPLGRHERPEGCVLRADLSRHEPGL